MQKQNYFCFAVCYYSLLGYCSMAWGKFFVIRLALAAFSASYQGSLPFGVYFPCTKAGKKHKPCFEGHYVQPSFWAMELNAFQQF